MANVTIPIIDLYPYFHGSQEERLAVAKQIGQACYDIGFFVIKNHNIDPSIINDVWSVTMEFFDLPLEQKVILEKDQNEYPFGYTSMGGEILSAGKLLENKKVEVIAPDLKEMFSIGPANPLAKMPKRLWPEQPASFAEKWTRYYDALNDLANHILKAFALDFGFEENYFEQFVDHHASAMRALNYPVVDGYEPKPGQLRASAHTDYGTITILRAGGPGLQVSKDKDPPTWVDVPCVEDAFIINLGDLMKRWTNDKWKSTLHQVIIPPKDSNWGRRQSIAFFHNVNPDAVIVPLTTDEEPKYEPIVAGDFLMQKHLASINAKANK